MPSFLKSLTPRSGSIWNSILDSLCGSDDVSDDHTTQARKRTATTFKENMYCRPSERTPTQSSFLPSDASIGWSRSRISKANNNKYFPPSDVTPTPSPREPIGSRPFPRFIGKDQSHDLDDSSFTECSDSELTFRVRTQLNMARQYHTITATTVTSCVLEEPEVGSRLQDLSLRVSMEDPFFSNRSRDEGIIRLKRDMWSSHVSFSDFRLHTGHRVLGGILTMPSAGSVTSSTITSGNTSTSARTSNLDEGTLTMYVQVNPGNKDEASGWREGERVMRVSRDVRIAGYHERLQTSPMTGDGSVTFDTHLEDADTKVPSTLWDTSRPVTMTVDHDSVVLGQIEKFGDVWIPSRWDPLSDSNFAVATPVYGLKLGPHDLNTAPWVNPARLPH